MSTHIRSETEVKDPPTKAIADHVAGLAASMKADGHDQETIRCALGVFAQAASAAQRESCDVVSNGRRF